MLGREQEWARIERNLAAPPQGGVVIALEGAPGIGKTTLALAAHDHRLLRPELARTLLERGTVLRRAKQKTAAKQSLAEALAIFETIRASLWAARTRDELQRVGLRRQSQQGLTPAQA